MREDEAERETRRARDICGDNGLRTVIFTYLLVRRERQVAVAAPDLYYNHSEVCRAVDWRDGGTQLSLHSHCWTLESILFIPAGYNN